MPDNLQGVKTPPHFDEAEQAVLGSMLLDERAADIAAETLKVEDFYNHRHGVFFEAMLDLHHERGKIDLLTVQARLQQKGTMSDPSDLRYLSEIASAVPTSQNITEYVKIVRESSFQRKMLNFGATIQTDVYGSGLNGEALKDKLETEFYNIVNKRDNADFKHVKEFANESLEDMHMAAENGGPIAGIKTGFLDLDEKTLGFMPSDLILVGARPAMGKTAFGLGMVLNMAVQNGKTCAVFSLEMSGKQVVNRFVSALSGVPLQNIRKGDLENSWRDITAAMRRLSASSIYIDDTGGITLSAMRSKLMRLKTQHGLDFVMLDYMQLMSGSGNGSDGRQNEIAEISRGLKALARELEVPILALSQLSRASETRSQHRPQLSDLRDSGQLEQDADMVIFLYRPFYYDPTNENGDVADIIIAKYRNGATGTIHLLYEGECTRFKNLERDDPRRNLTSEE